MEKGKVIIKEDINFLEYPMWVLSDDRERKSFSIKKENGEYQISSAFNLPVRVDRIILYYLLSKVLDKNTNKILLTKYKILKNTINRFSKTDYKMLMDSLDKWASVYIKFEGIFYEGEAYSTRGFHIIEGYKITKDEHKIEIQFNQQFIEQLENTNYYKLVNFNEYKRLKRPTSARLYEILIKNFKSRKLWKIEIKKLSEKLTLSDRFPSDISRRIKPAINEINKNTELKIDFSTYKNSDDETICIFKNKENKIQTEQMNINFKTDKSESKAYKFVLYEKLKEPMVLKIINEFNGDQDVLISSIKYANKNAKKNYAIYLKQTLDNNWGEHIREREKDLKKRYSDFIEASMEQTFKLTKGSEEECKELIFESILDMKNRIDDEFYFSPDFIFPIIEEMWERQHYSRREKTFEELKRRKEKAF